MDGRCGVTFAGWTGGDGTDPDGWSEYPGTGGRWGTAINYKGDAGIGSSVELVSGFWYWKQPSGSTHSGLLTGGTVLWPETLDKDIGCGPGIATVEATVVALRLEVPVAPGTLNACLDDTHLATVFPPRVWGTLTLTEPTDGAFLEISVWG